MTSNVELIPPIHPTPAIGHGQPSHRWRPALAGSLLVVPRKLFVSLLAIVGPRRS
ncbi:MAG TPA: hypothetical protein VNZ01_10510 [Solirubrobacteraceae bacterium]|nr:hypothetical protein [Solirubrobacteraceae bacterium]